MSKVRGCRTAKKKCHVKFPIVLGKNHYSEKSMTLEEQYTQNHRENFLQQRGIFYKLQPNSMERCHMGAAGAQNSMNFS